jgi:glycosyltransferase involved in cell wall biosynthesis
MKMPVVSTSIGCAGLKYENGRNLLVGDSPQEFARQTLSLLNDPAERRRLGEEGRKTAEQYYSWEYSARQLDALYQKFLVGNDAGSGKSAAGSRR